MDVIKATLRQGRLELAAPPDRPEGTEVLIEPTTAPPERIGIDESEWRDDPDSLAAWEAWIQTIEPLEFAPEAARRIAEFDERMLSSTAAMVYRSGSTRLGTRGTGSASAPRCWANCGPELRGVSPGIAISTAGDSPCRAWWSGPTRTRRPSSSAGCSRNSDESGDPCNRSTSGSRPSRSRWATVRS
jgi:hypothetical protein